jgi:hypothetical protein
MASFSSSSEDGFNRLKQNETFNELSPETVKTILHELEVTAAKRVNDGLNRFNFTFGVANTHLIVYMWAIYPQHFWILYLIEASFFLSFRFYKLCNKKPLNQALHFVDFCWFTSISFYIFFCIVLFAGGHQKMFSEVFREEFFLLAFGVACGPLMGALIITPLPLIFHNNETMASVFIHFFPPLQLYILRWNSSVMKEVWPTFWFSDFDFSNFWPQGQFTRSIFGNSLIFYFCWAVPYMIFQLCIGLDLPRTHRRRKHKNGQPMVAKYDTVYHYNMREGGQQCIWQGKLFWKRSEEESLRMMENNEYELRDFFVYMFLHFLGVFISIIVLAYSCTLSKYIHVAWLLGLFLVVIMRGANRYVYYSTKMYTSIIKKQFSALLTNEHDGYLLSNQDGDEEEQKEMMISTIKEEEAVVDAKIKNTNGDCDGDGDGDSDGNGNGNGNNKSNVAPSSL